MDILSEINIVIVIVIGSFPKQDRMLKAYIVQSPSLNLMIGWRKNSFSARSWIKFIILSPIKYIFIMPFYNAQIYDVTYFI